MIKKKSNGVNNILIILLIVISVCLVVSVCYITYDKIFKDDTVEKENDSKDNNDDVEVETDSIRLTKMLEKNVRMLERISIIGDYSSEGKFGRGVIYSNDFKNSDISDMTRLSVVLEQMYLDNNGKSPVTTDYNFSNDFMKSISVQLEVSDVEKLYKDLFGSSIVEHKSFGKCPYFIYDSVNSKYYASAQCGGTSSLVFDSYVYSVTTKGNNAYVYVSFGVVDYGNGKVVYTDYDMTKTYAGTISDFTNVVNENNYNDFSQYKFTFAKNGDSYLFEKIESLK